jgi:hypothetical protein
MFQASVIDIGMRMRNETRLSVLLHLNLISSLSKLCTYRQHTSGNCDNSNAIKTPADTHRKRTLHTKTLINFKYHHFLLTNTRDHKGLY